MAAFGWALCLVVVFIVIPTLMVVQSEAYRENQRRARNAGVGRSQGRVERPGDEPH